MENGQPPTDPYEVVLSDLRAKRAQIDAAIAAIEQIRGAGVAPAAAPNPAAEMNDGGAVRSGMFHGKSIPEAARELLELKKREMRNQEILDSLRAGGVTLTSADPVNTVGSVLNRRSKDVGDIVRVGRGTWGLASWYQNPQRFRAKSKISDDKEITEEGRPIEEKPVG